MSISIGRGEVAATFEETIEAYFPVLVDLLASSGIVSRFLLIITLLAIPIYVAYIVEKYEAVPQKLRNRFVKISGRYERDIEHTISTCWTFMANNETSENKRLHLAIKLYLGKRSKISSYTNGVIDLIDIPRIKSQTDTYSQGVRTSQELKNQQLVSFPVMGIWEKIPDTNPAIELKITQIPERCVSEYEQRQKTTFHLRTREKNGNKVLCNFIDRCHEEYISLMRANEDHSTYYYQLQTSSAGPAAEGEGSDAGAPIRSIFKRYRLAGERDFTTVFFPEKAKIIQLITDFSQKNGKFAIEGFPQKLGLLLHGPPGTGKTSFVKALAAHLKRHIVSIPLGKISTNQELYDIMFEGLYPCVNVISDDGESRKCFKHGFKDVIFLMEEVDAATDIVKLRKTAPTQGSTINQELTEPMVEDPCVESNTGESEYENEETALKNTRKGKSNADVVSQIGESPINASTGINNYKSLFAPADKLDLAGLLNVLDGVVDSPGRVVVMTTNHPEKLDPALIRPGRINMKLLLSFMKEKEAMEMIEQYFGKQEVENHQEKLHNVWASKQKERQREAEEARFEKTQRISLEEAFKITPAEMEQLCAENDTIGEFVSALNRFPELPARVAQISGHI